MKMTIPYDYIKKNENTFHFTTDKSCVYEIVLYKIDEFFEESCTTCNELLELTINCVSHECPSFDRRVGITVVNIVRTVLSEECVGLLYKILSNDGKQGKRELKFERWLEEYDEDGEIDLVAQEFCDSECDKFYLLTDRRCTNYQTAVSDFYNECSVCKRIDN